MAVATNGMDQAALIQAKSQAVQGYMMHHMMDSPRWTVLPGLHAVLPLGLTVDMVMVLGAALLLAGVLGLLVRRGRVVPTGALNAVECFVKYIRDEIAVPNLGEEDGRRLTPVFCSLFCFILVLNLLGLIPCFYTATANLGVTGALAVVSLGFMTLGAIRKHGLLPFLKGFAPPGVPGPLLAVIMPIEFVSLFIRAMALAIRLFANMLAGHLVIYSLLGLVVMFGWVAVPALGVALAIYLLEVFVAFLQAYIFTLLSAVFIGERYHPAH
jgi:F-type H+-transporting ATPase subunit a